ncbi:GFA family protein [Paralimibaculum aggregatum]|uniref:GFA family protein n=1 Tax=Paralimibaculum aggregatum TaxID=3036245 RepID=A0ABQ6LRQ7_9RHOB|nr:GFA family protein [Limibaculum sp. NKW23]GMG84928.1 GFA family protein [Limibaculum sp. NKW23]
MQGRCTCGGVRYALAETPLIVHACHCRWCQRETGSAFALNAVIEAAAVRLLSGVPEEILTPSASGRGQRIARCPACRVALWSSYPDAGPRIRFLRVGTLDEPDACPPDIHIYTASRQPWLVLPEGVPTVPEYYDPEAVWPAAALARWHAARAQPG